MTESQKEIPYTLTVISNRLAAAYVQLQFRSCVTDKEEKSLFKIQDDQPSALDGKHVPGLTFPFLANQSFQTAV